MMRALALALLFVLAIVACSSPPPPPKDSGPPVVCCTPSPYPECCMQLGGAQQYGSCPPLTCDIPDPGASGWFQSKDGYGCLRWYQPPGPYACGAPPPPPPIDAGLPCAPGVLTGFTPKPITPPNPSSDACTANAIDGFYAACIAQDFTSAACVAFQSANASCTACLASNGGAVAVSQGEVTFDVPGCIALVQNDATSTSCAQRASDELACEAFACDAVCPLGDGGLVAREQCTQEAASGECLEWLQAECDGADAGLAPCVAPIASASAFRAFASVFCGGT